MEQGLRILIQLVLEFTPMIVALVQKREGGNLALAKDKSLKEIQEFIQTVSAIVPIEQQNTSIGEFEPISKLPYREILDESAKTRALEWKKL